MSLLGEKRWALMSERGCEATGVAYAEAAELMRRLKGEKVSGLCVITERAASHLAPARNGKKGKGGDDSKRPKRAASGKSATQR